MFISITSLTSIGITFRTESLRTTDRHINEWISIQQAILEYNSLLGWLADPLHVDRFYYSS